MICSKCNLDKPEDNFLICRKGKHNEYRLTYCDDCRRLQLYANLNNNYDRFLADRFNRLRIRADKLNIPFDMDIITFKQIYDTQLGKCIYTRKDMVLQVGSGKNPDSLSIDKIIPAKGYVYGNIVFCTNRINSIKFDVTLDEMKVWMPVFYRNLMEYKDIVWYD